MMESLDLPPLPEGWEWTKVINLKGLSGLIKDGDWILSEDLKTGNEVRLIQLADIGQGYFLDRSNKFISKKRALELNCTFLKAGDILISRMAYPIARACILPHIQYDSITAVDVTILRPDLEFFDKNFICWLFNSELIRKQAEQLSSGTTRKRISRKNLETLDIPLPPLPEQHRIVAKIEELFTKLDAGVESLKNVKAQLRLYRQAVLKHAFEGKLTEEWRERHKDELEPASVLLERIKEERKKNAKGNYKELPPLDTADLPELHEGWVWAKVGEICVTTSGGTPSRKNKRYYGGTIPWLKSGELENKIITSTEEYITEEGLENSSAKIIPKGTLLMALYGATVGKLGILGIDSAINQAICAIFAPSQLEKKYLFWYLMDYRNELLNSRIGGAQPNISQTIVNKVTLPFPSLPEQHKIVEEIERRFSLTDEVERTVNQSLKQTERLRQSILKNAFEGKLVPQDPSDEPASVLLERIKEERKNREIEEKSKSKNKRKRDLVLKQRRFNEYAE